MPSPKRPRALDLELPLTKSKHAGQRPCDWPGCQDAGEHRAPKDRDRLNEFYWFCMEHIRVYNKAWNYYAGMSPAEIEADRRRDTTWQRKTWKFGSNSENVRKEAFDDAFGLFDDEEEPAARQERKRDVYGAEANAFRTLELEPTATLEEIKAQFKTLSKRHHPDTNAGDKDAEERFKEINAAYQVLVASMSA